jgi:ligand-binding SRPBCC domain-containing protein
MHQVFSFFGDAANLEAITPPWLSFQILTPGPIAMHVGTRLHYRLKWHGVPIFWETAIVTWSPPHLFSDEQVRGPYRLWRHVHSFHPDPAGTRMIDVVSYELPLGPIGEMAHAWAVKRDLDRIFDFRARVIEDAFPPQPGVRR